MKHETKYAFGALFAALTAAFSLNAQAATSDTTVVSTTAAAAPATTSSIGNSQTARISSQFANWAGSSANAASLVSGLRTGSAITLQPTPLPGTTAPATAGAVTFTPPTQSMGWGNVTKALSLAQADLAAMGISNPTPQQLQTALTGGDITVIQGATVQTTHIDGVLTMRNQGMGWGQIAHKLDLHPGTAFKPGTVENRTHAIGESHDLAHKELHHNTETDLHEEHHVLSANGTTVRGSSRVTTAAGTAGGLDHENHEHNSHETSHEFTHTSHAPISRIVTAAGAPVSSSASFNHTEHGGSHIEVQQVSHITTAAGGSMGASGGLGGEHGKSFGHGKD